MPNPENNLGITNPTATAEINVPNQDGVIASTIDAKTALENMFVAKFDGAQKEPAQPEADPQPQPKEDDVADENEPPAQEDEGNEPPKDDDQDNQDENQPPEHEDENDVPEGVFNAEQQKVVNKIIGKVKGKLTAIKGELETANAALATAQTEAESAKAEVLRIKADAALPPQNPQSPLLGVITTPQKLQEYKSSQLNLKEQILRNANQDDGSTFVILNNGQRADLTAEDARDQVLRIDRFLGLDAPQLERHIAVSGQLDNWLATNVPDSARANSPLDVAINSVIASFPAVKTAAGPRTTSFCFLVGRMLAEKIGAGAAWNYVNKLDKGAAPQQNAGSAKKRVVSPPPPPAKKSVPKAQGPAAPQKASGPLTRDAAETLLENRLFGGGA